MVFRVAVGIAALALAVVQGLAALDLVALNSWPFVRTRNRWLRFAGAGGWFAIGAILIVGAL